MGWLELGIISYLKIVGFLANELKKCLQAVLEWAYTSE